MSGSGELLEWNPQMRGEVGKPPRKHHSFPNNLRTALHGVKTVAHSKQVKAAPRKPSFLLSLLPPPSITALEEVKTGTPQDLYAMLKTIPPEKYPETYFNLIKGTISSDIRKKCAHGKIWISLDPTNKIRLANRATMTVTIGESDLEFEAGVTASTSNINKSQYFVQLNRSGGADDWTKFSLLDVQFIKYVKKKKVEQEKIEKRQRGEHEGILTVENAVLTFERIVPGATSIYICDDQSQLPKTPDNGEIWLCLDYSVKKSPDTVRNFEFQHAGQLYYFKAKVYTQKNRQGSLWLHLTVGACWTMFTVLDKIKSHQDTTEKRAKVDVEETKTIAMAIEKATPETVLKIFDLFWDNSEVHSVFFDIVEGVFPADFKIAYTRPVEMYWLTLDYNEEIADPAHILACYTWVNRSPGPTVRVLVSMEEDKTKLKKLGNFHVGVALIDDFHMASRHLADLRDDTIDEGENRDAGDLQPMDIDEDNAIQGNSLSPFDGLKLELIAYEKLQKDYADLQQQHRQDQALMENYRKQIDALGQTVQELKNSNSLLVEQIRK
jgi:hypothetical protein